MNHGARDPSGTRKMLDGIHSALLIHNPRAGRSGPKRAHRLEEARRIFAAAGVETELCLTSTPGEATWLARRAAREGRGLVIVCGGDGTMNEALNGVVAEPSGRQIPLALLPGDRKSTRLNSSHLVISYAVFCLKKKKTPPRENPTTTNLHASVANASHPT